MVTFFGIISILGIVAAIVPGFADLWAITLCIFAGVFLMDFGLCLKRPELTVSREIRSSLPVSSQSSIKIMVESRDRRILRMRIYDLYPQGWEAEGLPAEIILSRSQQVEFEYKISPAVRGDFTLPGCDCIVSSPFLLWQKKWLMPHESKVKVFPNFREIGHYTLLSAEHHLSMMGIKKRLRRGEGKEFHQLREYRQGDELQKIDWKATSRMRKLISKEYQDERDQNIVFVVDSGRRMAHEEKGKSHLDQALNSILLLGYVACRQGDAVGMYCFGGTSKWHPPRKEAGSSRSLLFAAYDVKTANVASDFLQATRDILSLQRRRSLMVIITNSRSEDYDDLLQMVRQLRHKHLVVIADLRESVLDETVEKPIVNHEDALRFQAVQQYLIQRRKLFRQLQHLGVLVLDITARQLPASLVNTYLEIKGAGRL